MSFPIRNAAAAAPIPPYRRGERPAPDDSQDLINVLVAVLTYRRPEQLREYLPLIDAQVRQVSADSRIGGLAFDVKLVVIDNDPERTGEESVRASGTHIRYATEATPGIAAARNRALVEGRDAHLLVFIDDDEIPRPGWLSSLLETWSHSRPAAVPGRVVPNYQITPDPWIVSGGFFDRPVRATGTPLASAAAGNLLLDLNQIREIGLTFEEPFGMTGGEDSLFGRRLSLAGGSIIWCHESVVEDVVPAERLTKSWVLRRAWCLGNLSSLIDIHLKNSVVLRSVTRLRRIAAGLILIAAGGYRQMTGRLVGSLSRDAQGSRTLQRGAGMAWGALGRTHEQYARTQGRENTPRLQALETDVPDMQSPKRARSKG